MTGWLSERLVLALHEEQLREHGGAAGLRDRGLLQGALARPVNRAGYGNPGGAITDDDVIAWVRQHTRLPEA